MGVHYYWDNLTKQSFDNEGNHYSNIHRYSDFFGTDPNIFERIVNETIEEFGWDATDHVVCKTYDHPGACETQILDYHDGETETFNFGLFPTWSVFKKDQ